MRAVRIKGAGGVEVLKVEETERPRVAADRVLVRVHAAGLNRADVLQRRGAYPAPAGAPADIPGLEFAGEVIEVGAEVRTRRVGERVFGITGGGAQADFVSAPESALAVIPDNLSYTEAAAVPEVFITAHDALFTQARLAMGERVLIHAAGSGVGTAAVQLARAAGSGGVYGTARSAEKLEGARALGLDEGVVVGDNPQQFVEAVREWTRGGGVHVILDLVGASYLAANLEAASARGRLILVGTLGGAKGTLDFGTVMRKRLMLQGTVLRARTTEEKAQAVSAFATSVVPLLARGHLRPVIDSVFPFARIRAAHERLESNQTFGKVVLQIGEE